MIDPDPSPVAGLVSRSAAIEVAALPGPRVVEVRGLAVHELAQALRALGFDVRSETESPTRPLGGADLAHRERQIVELIAAGLSNKDIAAHLVLSVNTIKSHIRSAYRKMGVETRAQAVRWALEHLGDARPDPA